MVVQVDAAAHPPETQHRFTEHHQYVGSFRGLMSLKERSVWDAIVAYAKAAELGGATVDAPDIEARCLAIALAGDSPPGCTYGDGSKEMSCRH